MAWSDEQLELLAWASCGGGPYITPDNFSMVADLVKRGFLTVTDGDEGAICASSTPLGIKLALKMKIITEKAPDDYTSGNYSYGEKHPLIVKRDARAAKRKAATTVASAINTDAIVPDSRQEGG